MSGSGASLLVTQDKPYCQVAKNVGIANPGKPWMTRQNGYGEPAQTDMISFSMACNFPSLVVSRNLMDDLAHAHFPWQDTLLLRCSRPRLENIIHPGKRRRLKAATMQVNPFIAALESTFNICCPRSTLHQPIQIRPMSANDHLYCTSPDYSRTNHQKNTYSNCCTNVCTMRAPKHLQDTSLLSAR